MVVVSAAAAEHGEAGDGDQPDFALAGINEALLSVDGDVVEPLMDSWRSGSCGVWPGWKCG